MAVLFPIVAGSVLWVICGFTWLARRETRERVEAIEALSPVPIADLRPGTLAAVEGWAVEDAPDRLGEPMACSDVELVREDQGDEVLWRAESVRALQVRDDADDHLVVELAAAEIQLPWVEVERAAEAPSERMAALLQAADLDVPPTDTAARYVLRRRGLGPDAPVTVLGVPRVGEAVVMTAASGLTVVTEDRLAVLQARERADLRALGRMLIGGALVGVVFLAVGALAIAFS